MAGAGKVGAGLTVMEYACETEAPSESVTFIVKVAVPAAVGVLPNVTLPVDELIVGADRPVPPALNAGLMVVVKLGVPPLTVMLCV